MKLSLASVMLVALLAAATQPAAAQDSAASSYPEPPVLEQSQTTAPNVLEFGQLVPVVDPPPPATNSPVANPDDEKYRPMIETLAAHKHTYVHIRLKNGKVLTGLLRDVGYRSFSIHTTAIGGPTVFYKDIAEQPRPVAAVGTRLIQGAQWTGLVVFVAAVMPILIPLMLTGAVSDC